MPDIRFHPLADADLDNIVYYTTVKWGEDQARKYGHQIISRVADFAEGRAIGKAVSSRLREIKILRAGHHYICLHLGPNGNVTVIAILHERMDLVNRLAQRLKQLCPE